MKNRLWKTLAATAVTGALGCTTEEAATTTTPAVVEQVPCTGTPGSICTWAGNGEAGFNGDGLAPQSSMLYWPIDLTFTSKGRTFVLDWNNHAVREVQEDGSFLTVIGDGFVGDGPPDRSDLTPAGADGYMVTLNHPTQFIELPSGRLLLSAWHNHKMREYDPETGKVYVSVGGPPGFYGDGGPAKAARLNQPVSISLRKDGGYYILDQRNQNVRLVDAAGNISSVAGKREIPAGAPLPAGGYDGEGGKPLEARFNQPTGSNPPPGGSVVVDPNDDEIFYVADQLNQRIRKVDLKAQTVTTVAGTGEAGFSGDGGLGTAAQIHTPREISFGPDGRLYIADQMNHRIRALDLTTGIIETVAGTGEAGYSGDGGDATSAQLNRPNGFAFNDGYLYIADTDNHRIRRVTLAN